MDQNVGGRREKLRLVNTEPQEKTAWGFVARCVVLTLLVLLCVVLFFAETRKPDHLAITPVEAPQEAASEPEEGDPMPEEPEITLTEVSPGVFRLYFGGADCSSVACLNRATELVLKQPSAGSRIISMAQIAMCGSSAVLSIITN